MENNKTLSWDEIEQAHKNMMEDLKIFSVSLILLKIKFGKL